MKIEAPNRRSFLRRLGLIAFPAIVPASSLRQVRPYDKYAMIRFLPHEKPNYWIDYNALTAALREEFFRSSYTRLMLGPQFYTQAEHDFTKRRG